MPELDHLIFAASDLAAGVAHIEALCGIRAQPGGPHPGVGTHNALLTFDDATYFEIIAVDPDQPDPGRPRPFGLDEGAGPRLAGYAVHPGPGETMEDLVELLRVAGHDPGPIVAMRRVRPDGVELSWRLTLGHRSDTPAGVPFAIDWGETPSPARSLPSMGRLVALRVQHPDAGQRAVAESLGLGPVVVDDGPRRLTAVIDGPSGRFEIS